MTDKTFYKHFREHLTILKKEITKDEMLENLEFNKCPFICHRGKRKGFFLFLRDGKVTLFGDKDKQFEECSRYFRKHIPRMIEIIKKTKW